MIADRLTIAGLFGLVGLVGCGETRPETTVVVRDSAGIRIVANSVASSAAAGWRVSDRATLQIGVLEGDSLYQFQFVTGAARLDDGRIVVADAGADALRAYDPTGRHLWSAGRDGDGPGEFRNIGWVRPHGPDSLMVYDRSLRRVSVFSVDGVFAGSAALEAPGGVFRPQAIGPFADGSIMVLATQNVTPRLGPGIHRLDGWIARYSADGRLTDSIGTVAGQEWVGLAYETGRVAVLTVRSFGRDLDLDVFGDRAYVAETDRYEVRVYTNRGRLERVIRLDRPNAPLTAADVDRYRTDRESGVTDADQVRSLRRMLDAMPFPDTYPAFRRFLVDRIGNLWVEEYAHVGDTTSVYTVFDATGRLVGSVDMAEGIRVMEIGGDYVLGVWRDELDVQYVRMYGLSKTGSGE